MSYKTATYYGYRVGNNLSDVIDKVSALRELNLNIKDLDIIRSAASTDGATREDLIAISDLSVPLYKTLDRYIGETNRYGDILDSTAGVDTILRGNLQINGVIGGSAIRYKFIEYTRRLNFSSVTGTLFVNERLTSSVDPTCTGIIKEFNDAGKYVIVGNITGGPFVDGRVFTGSYSGKAFTLTSSTPSYTVKYADISTSRVSAWSSASVGVPTDADPIFYGGQLKIVNGGKVTVDKITWGQTAIERLKRPNGSYITGEIPTHAITVNINGQAVKLYAMKSIPLKFRGFFSRFDSQVNFSSAVAGSRVSWRIINVNNPADTQTYTEIGTTSTSTLRYRAINAAERDIEIYYHPDYIRQLYLNSTGISNLPSAELPNLFRLEISNNAIKDIPNVKAFAPNLETLNIGRNSLYLASDESLRKLTKAVADRLPITLTNLNINSTFFGSIRCVNSTNTAEITSGIGGNDSYSAIEKACPNLQVFNANCDRNTSKTYFSPDDYDSNAYLPSMPDTLTEFYANYNDFRKVPARGIKNLSNLKIFSVYDNYQLSDPDFSLESNELTSVDIGGTLLPIPPMALKPNLVTFASRWNRNITTTLFTNDSVDSTYKFSGCSALEKIDLYGSRVRGYIPKFTGNINLKTVDLYSCDNITGGRPNGTDYVLYKDTFQDARNIEFFRVHSHNLLVGKGFEPDTFKNLGSLRYLHWYSYGRTGLGGGVEIPDISSCPSLDHLIMPANNFTGPVPSMVTNNNIYYIDLSSNRLTGTVPTYSNRIRLRYVLLHNNRLSSFIGFEGTTNLEYVYLQNNLLAGDIPMLSGGDKSPRLIRFYAFNNQFRGYTLGSFAGLTRLQILDISKNLLSAFDINNIIDDLYENYLAAPRGKVNINLRSQAVSYIPSVSGTPKEAEAANKIEFLRSKGWTVTVG